MRQLVNILEANQHLSRYIEAVREGGEIIITRRGLPVAKLVGIEETAELSATQEEARHRTLARMRKGYSLGGRAPQRDSLHGR